MKSIILASLFALLTGCQILSPSEDTKGSRKQGVTVDAFTYTYLSVKARGGTAELTDYGRAKLNMQNITMRDVIVEGKLLNYPTIPRGTWVLNETGQISCFDEQHNLMDTLYTSKISYGFVYQCGKAGKKLPENTYYTTFKTIHQDNFTYLIPVQMLIGSYLLQ